MGWKTIAGALVWFVGSVSSPEVLALLPDKWAHIVAAAGALLGAIGARHAIAKSGR